MEETGGSQSITTTVQSQHARLMVPVPRDYLIAPFFAAARQDPGVRRVTVRTMINGTEITKQYFMGGFHPLRPSNPPPALDVRHARALFVILSFRGRLSRRKRDREKEANPRFISFSFEEFCRRYARTNGGRYSKSIREILADLTDSYIRVLDLQANVANTYRLIERLDIEEVIKPICRSDAALATTQQQEFYFHGCYLSDAFYELLEHVVELQYLKLDVFTSIRSPLAQAIYLYIPSRAYHRTEADPFEITLTNLLTQVGAPVPKYKSLRHKLFTQNSKSIIKQLDFAETLRGRFRVRLVETSDGTDWKLQFWETPLEKPKPAINPETSKILAAYLKSGRSRESFDEALTKIRPLSDFELHLIDLAEIELDQCHDFLKMVKALIGEYRFDSLLGEAKCDVLEGRRATKSPTARLIYRLMETLSTAPSETVKTSNQTTAWKTASALPPKDLVGAERSSPN